MKTSQTCPKCHSTDLLRLPEKGYANMIRTKMTRFKIVFKYVYLTRFVCANCGYSEQWLESREDIDILRKCHQPL